VHYNKTLTSLAASRGCSVECPPATRFGSEARTSDPSDAQNLQQKTQRT
jgi:hypothetical protein